MEKKSTKVDFSPISYKKASFYIVNWTFKGMCEEVYYRAKRDKKQLFLHSMEKKVD